MAKVALRAIRAKTPGFGHGRTAGEARPGVTPDEAGYSSSARTGASAPSKA